MKSDFVCHVMSCTCFIQVAVLLDHVPYIPPGFNIQALNYVHVFY